MIEEKLPDLLDELVEQVDAPSMASAAWARATQVRRRQRVLAVAAATMLVAGVVPVIVSTVDAAPGPASGRVTSPSPSGNAATPPEQELAPRVQAGPERRDVPALPSLDSPLTALGSLPPTAKPLSDDPLPRVLAAAQRTDGPVLLVGRDGRWRQVPVTAGEQARLTPTSISPDGSYLALVQDAGVVLVDVSTSSSRRLTVTGPVAQSIQAVAWLSDGTHVVVGGDAGDVSLSVIDGSQQATELRASEVVAGRRGEPTIAVTDDGLVSRPPGGTQTTVPPRTSGAGTLRQWYGGVWSDAGRVAGTAFRAGTDQQVVAVIDAATGQVTHVLELPSGEPPNTRSNGCCGTLGWLDGRTIILRDGGHLLAWRPSSSELLRVASLPGTAQIGADSGYDVTVAINP